MAVNIVIAILIVHYVTKRVKHQLDQAQISLDKEMIALPTYNSEFAQLDRDDEFVLN